MSDAVYVVERVGIGCRDTVAVRATSADAIDTARQRTVPTGARAYHTDADGYHAFAVSRWVVGTDEGVEVGQWIAPRENCTRGSDAPKWEWRNASPAPAVTDA